jgi:hypothetical protein
MPINEVCAEVVTIRAQKNAWLMADSVEDWLKRRREALCNPAINVVRDHLQGLRLSACSYLKQQAIFFLTFLDRVLFVSPRRLSG